METLGSSDSYAEFWYNVERAMAIIVEIFSNKDDGRICVSEFWRSDELRDFTYEEIQTALARLFDKNMISLINGATEYRLVRQ